MFTQFLVGELHYEIPSSFVRSRKMFDDLCLNTKFELFWQPNDELISWISHIETNKVKYSTIYYDINWTTKLKFLMKNSSKNSMTICLHDLEKSSQKKSWN